MFKEAKNSKGMCTYKYTVIYFFYFFFTFQHLYTVPRNTPSSGTPSHGVVYGVVQRSENNQQNEVVVYEWSSHQLKEEMNYIKDVC